MEEKKPNPFEESKRLVEEIMAVPLPPETQRKLDEAHTALNRELYLTDEKLHRRIV